MKCVNCGTHDGVVCPICYELLKLLRVEAEQKADKWKEIARIYEKLAKEAREEATK